MNFTNINEKFFFDIFWEKIPDEVIEYYLKKTGFSCPDIRMFVAFFFIFDKEKNCCTHSVNLCQ
jgi:hypothetical protein